MLCRQMELNQDSPGRKPELHLHSTSYSLTGALYTGMPHFSDLNQIEKYKIFLENSDYFLR